MDQLLFSPGILRLFLALTVVVSHGTKLSLGAWAVYVFFCLSGYWITVMYRSKYSKFNYPAIVFYVSRYLRLLPIYVLCQVLMLVGLAIVGVPTVVHGLTGLIWIFRSLIIVTSASQAVYLGPAWTLDLEVQFYLFFPLLAYILLKLPESIRLNTVYALTIASLLFNFIFAGPRETFLPYYLCFFLLGVSNAVKPWKPGKAIGLASGIGFLLIVVTMCIVPEFKGYLLGGAHILSPSKFKYNYLLCALLTVVCYPYLCYSLSFRSTELDKHLGNLAYPIYLFHWISQRLIIDNTLHLPFNRIELTSLHLAVVAIGSGSIYLLIDRPLDDIRERYLKNKFQLKLKPVGKEPALDRVGRA